MTRGLHSEVPLSPPRKRMLLLTHDLTAAWATIPWKRKPHKRSSSLVWGAGLEAWLLAARRLCPPFRGTAVLPPRSRTVSRSGLPTPSFLFLLKQEPLRWV